MPPKQQKEPKEREQQQITDEVQDQDIENKRFLFMTMASTAGISMHDLEDFIVAQKADPILTKFRELLEADLTRCGM